jgi:hypothetical protein
VETRRASYRARWASAKLSEGCCGLTKASTPALRAAIAGLGGFGRCTAGQVVNVAAFTD